MRKSSITITVPAATLGRFIAYCEEAGKDPNEEIGKMIESYLEGISQPDSNKEEKEG